jgi:hypothetical protein
VENLLRPHSYPGFKVRKLGSVNFQGFHGTAGPSATPISKRYRKGSRGARTAGIARVVPQEGMPPGEAFQRPAGKNHGGVVVQCNQ